VQYSTKAKKPLPQRIRLFNIATGVVLDDSLNINRRVTSARANLVNFKLMSKKTKRFKVTHKTLNAIAAIIVAIAYLLSVVL